MSNSSKDNNISNNKESINSNDNMEFPYPFAIDDKEDLEKIDYKYNYNEADFEKINEEFINEITNFKFDKNDF